MKAAARRLVDQKPWRKTIYAVTFLPRASYGRELYDCFQLKMGRQTHA